jgi:hypothetical protein
MMYNAFYIKGMVEYIVNSEEGLTISVFHHREAVWRADDQIVLPRNEEETTIGAPIYDSVENPLEVKQLLSD